jgi:hypothetical protein
VICIGRMFLLMIGTTPIAIKQLALEGNHGGIAVSEPFFFGGKSGNDYVKALALEPEPRELLLVGMTDRYGYGAKLARVTSICADVGVRTPNMIEALTLISRLESCDHPAAPNLRVRLHCYLGVTSRA